MQIAIGKEFENKTIKDWLYQNNISRGMITELKKRPLGITLNGEHATVRRVLHKGDILALELEDRSEDTNENLIPTKMELDIIYEDDDIIAVNKPCDMATHPSIGHFTDTLANGLCYYFASKGTPFVFRSINRLDRDTSGIVLVAKNRVAASELAALMQSGKIKKTYIAVLCGRLTPECGRIDAAIRRREQSIITREVCSPNTPDGKSALTVYQTLAASHDATIVRAEPVTGRTHQLRVHFSHLGCPIAGDGLYGYAESTPTVYDRMMTRHALHAASLVIARGQTELRLEAKLPPDMQALCATIINQDRN